MAKTIYDYWFTQLDFPNGNKMPYKTSGGKIVWNKELKTMIPAGWHVDKLKNICKLYLGGTPDTSIPKFWNGSIPWLNSGEIQNFPIVSSALTITKEGLECSPTKLMKKDTVVISITGNIRTSILAIESCANQSVVGVEENDILKKSYLYPFITNKLDAYSKLATGNCQKHINKSTLEESFILIPPQDILFDFYNLVNPLYNNIEQNAIQTKYLKTLREWLLPMLMNGQATISN